MTDSDGPQDATSNDLLVVRELHKSYETEGVSVPALRGVDLRLERGVSVALTGPSGCGKSTLLHLIGAMDRPTSGSIRLRDVELTSLSEERLTRVRRRELGFVFQFFNLLPTLTALENVALPLLLDGVPRRDALSRAEPLLARVGLASKARRYATALSGGEMQRAAVARALVHQPALVLADEPTGSLDSSNGAQVMDLIAELERELGVTFLVATHSEEVASRCRRRVALRDGLVEASPAA